MSRLTEVESLQIKLSAAPHIDGKLVLLSWGVVATQGVMIDSLEPDQATVLLQSHAGDVLELGRDIYSHIVRVSAIERPRT